MPIMFLRLYWTSSAVWLKSVMNWAARSTITSSLRNSTDGQSLYLTLNLQKLKTTGHSTVNHLPRDEKKPGLEGLSESCGVEEGEEVWLVFAGTTEPQEPTSSWEGNSGFSSSSSSLSSSRLFWSSVTVLKHGRLSSVFPCSWGGRSQYRKITTSWRRHHSMHINSCRGERRDLIGKENALKN